MEQIEYTRTVVPSSMRSPYWKYFGFPSDNGNNILTRQKIVCTICKTAIAYNKNTSNLRTHLMSKHVEIFQKIVASSNCASAQKDNTSFQHSDDHVKTVKEQQNVPAIDYINNLNTTDSKRRCTEMNNVEVTASVQNKNECVESFLSSSQCSHNFEQDSNIHRRNVECASPNKSQSTDFITFFPSSDCEIVTESDHEVFGSSMHARKSEEKSLYTCGAYFQKGHELNTHPIDTMLADLIQTDLLPLDTLEEHGFCKYNQQLSGLKLDDVSISRVIDVIENRFRNVKQTITAHVYHLSQSQPYSLGFEIYKDNEEQDILNIYFNYLNDNQIDLVSILFASSTICNNTTNISELLVDINIENCSGVVINCQENMFEFVSEFTKSYDLPLIECLESMLTHCLQKIFEQTKFCADYEKLLKMFFETKQQAQHIRRTNLRPRCIWRRLNFLEYMFQNMDENKLEQWSELKRSIEYLKPLKMAMDIIIDEPLPLCSLIRPLVKKLFEEHYSSTNQEEKFLTKIQNIVEKELYKKFVWAGSTLRHILIFIINVIQSRRIVGKSFLNEVTFFDLRFNRDFALQESFFDITHLKTEVVNRLKNILPETCIYMQSDTRIEQSSNNRKSGLKSFFNRGVSLTSFDVTTNLKTNLDLEIEQYETEACLDLDQSPVLWWQQQSDTYKQLSKIAKHYLTIPCCCLPRLCRIDTEQRYCKLDRRKNLSQFCNTESKLWYLYYNEAVAELL